MLQQREPAAGSGSRGLRTGRQSGVLGAKQKGHVRQDAQIQRDLGRTRSTGQYTGCSTRIAHLLTRASKYSDPEGGYFVLVNMAKVKLPADYEFPPHVASRPRDFKLSWFLIMEVGVAAIPPTEFYTPENAHLAEDYLRFAFCKNDDVLETAKERLRSLKKYIQD